MSADAFSDWVEFIINHPQGESHPSAKARLNLIVNGSDDEVRRIAQQNGASGSEAQVAAMKKVAEALKTGGAERQG